MAQQPLARVRIVVERATASDGHQRLATYNVVVERGPDRVVIPLGYPRSQAARLAARLGDVLALPLAQDDVRTLDQLALL